MEVSRKIRESFISGLIIAAPVLLTLLILKILYDWSLILINPVVQGTELAMYTGNVEVVAQMVAGLSALLFITLLGATSKNYYGKKMIGEFGKLANIVPVFRTFYFTIKQVANSVVENESRFEKAVVVEYPRNGVYAIGFVTSESNFIVSEESKPGLYNVFIPNSPNPTNGLLRMFSEDEISELDISIRKALRIVMTTGMAVEKEELPDEIHIDEINDVTEQ